MFKSLKSKLAYSSVAVGSLFASASSFAADGGVSIPKPAQDAIASIGDIATGMIDLAWPVIAVVVGGFLAIKQFKKVASRV